eukprot:4191542-Prymnesium_polylepis.2
MINCPCPRPPRGLHSPCVLGPGVPGSPGAACGGAPDRTGPSRHGVRTPKNLSPACGGHGLHAYAPRLAPRPRRTTTRSPRRTCRPHRVTGPPNAPWSTHRHSNQRRRRRVGALRGRHYLLDLPTTRTPFQRHRRAA